MRRKANSKNIHNIYQQSTLEHDPSSEPYDWQPFLSTAHRRHDRSSKEYIPLVVNTQKEKRDNTFQLNSKSKQEDNKKPMSSHIIYVDPRILRKVFELKNQRKQIQSRSISIEQATLVDSNSLNEILNKNPHIQLESLRNILQDPNQRNRIFPVIEGPQPFQQKDHTPITERTVDVPNPRSKPNIQVNHDQPQDQQAHPQQHTQEDNDPVLTSIIPQQGQTITKEAFDQIQKQLEASSKYQVHDALFRAQQDAQAHVEAQHKAIEQAQRAILENVQKQLQDAGGSPEALRYVQEQIPQFKSSEKNSEDAPQALRLVQENVPQYVTHINVPMSVPVYPTPLPKQVVSPVHQVTIPTSNVRIQSYKPTSLPDYIPKNVAHGKEQNIVREQPQLPKFKIIKINPSTTQIPKHFFIQPQNKQNLISQKPTAAQQSLAKKIEHYAPNHLHQAVAQLQAEKVLLAQVQSHNNAIMNAKKGGNRYVGQKSQIDYASADKVQDKEAHGSANAYQHIVLEPKQKSREKQIHHEEPQDENDDVSKSVFLFSHIIQKRDVIYNPSNISDEYEEYYEYYDDDTPVNITHTSYLAIKNDMSLANSSNRSNNDSEYYYEYYDDEMVEEGNNKNLNPKYEGNIKKLRNQSISSKVNSLILKVDNPVNLSENYYTGEYIERKNDGGREIEKPKPAMLLPYHSKFNNYYQNNQNNVYGNDYDNPQFQSDDSVPSRNEYYDNYADKDYEIMYPPEENVPSGTDYDPNSDRRYLSQSNYHNPDREVYSIDKFDNNHYKSHANNFLDRKFHLPIQTSYVSHSHTKVPYHHHHHHKPQEVNCKPVIVVNNHKPSTYRKRKKPHKRWRRTHKNVHSRAPRPSTQEIIKKVKAAFSKMKMDF